MNLYILFSINLWFQLLQDSFPERAEDFYLVLTRVEKFPTVVTEGR